MDRKDKIIVLLMAAVMVSFGMTGYAWSGLPESPTIVEVNPAALSRDAVFIGALTFAGLGIFGSSVLARVHRVRKSDLRRRKVAVMGYTGSFGVVAVQLGLAARMCCVDPGPILIQGTLYLSFGLALAAAAAYLYLAQTDPSNTLEHK